MGCVFPLMKRIPMDCSAVRKIELVRTAVSFMMFFHFKLELVLETSGTFDTLISRN